MNVTFSKDFAKALDKMSGKLHESVVAAINSVILANKVTDIPNCIKVVSLNNVYRIRIGGYRAFFVLQITIEDNGTACFKYLVSRGEAYNKENMMRLKIADKS